MDDRTLLEQTERAIQTGQRTGNDLIDVLAGTTPLADPRFKERLEGNLIARMKATGERSVYFSMNGQSIRTQRAVRVPYTLVAAMLLVVIVGSVLVFLSRTPPSKQLFLAQSEASPTPVPTSTPIATPRPVFTLDEAAMREALQTASLQALLDHAEALRLGGVNSVVVAVQDIRRGTEITRDMLAVVYWPNDALPQGVYSELAAVTGLYAVVDIPSWQPVFRDHAASLSPELSGTPAALLPPGTVAIALPGSSATASLQPGDKVDVFVSLLSVDVAVQRLELVPVIPFPAADLVSLFPIKVQPGSFSDPESQLVIQRVIEDAEVIHSAEDAVTLAVSPQDATALAWFIEAKVPITLLENSDD